MDKKNTILGILFLVAALALMFWQTPKPQPPAERPTTIERGVDRTGAPSSIQNAGVVADDAPLRLADAQQVAAYERPEEQLLVLENEFMLAELSSWGGAIRRVALKQYRAVQGEDAPYVFNEHGDVPALSISRAGREGAGVAEYAPHYRVVESSGSRVVFEREVISGVFFVREYSISNGVEGAEPYLIQHRTTIVNRTESVVNMDPLYVSIGTAAPDAADPSGYNLNAGYFDGSDYDFERITKFTGGGFWFFRKAPVPSVELHQPVVWGSVKNQFFVSILTPQVPANGILMKPVIFPPRPDSDVRRGITASLRFDPATVQPGAQVDLAMEYYVGPKEYFRLTALDKDQDEVMQFGWRPIGGGIIAFIGKAFYTGLVAVHNLVGNWGLAIIIVTILIRLVFWPLTAKAAESSRRMAKIQEPIKELREKYKDNPRKLNEEMMKLWKAHKVNPMAGCLPILIQIPIFLAFFYMLRGASELRFAEFLWIEDLSLPDSIAQVAGFSINLLPLLMGLSMFYQMKLAPTPAVDPMQVKILRLMPVFLVVVCYGFSAGLVLYWTTSNCMSILQQFHTNHKRRKEDVDAGGATVLEAEVVKNKAHQGRAKIKGKRKPNA